MLRSVTAVGPRRVEWLTAARSSGAALLLCGVVAVAYGPAVSNFYVSDDLDMLSGDASDLFSPASGFGRFMPLAAAVHRAVAVNFGLNPIPAHALQAVLHAACALLVYALTRELARPRHRAESRALALTAALLFALYPRHHQVVMWFGAISIGLAATLALLTALLSVLALRRGSARLGWAAAATYAAALIAHESAVVLPLLLLVLAGYLRTVGTDVGDTHGQAGAPARSPTSADPAPQGHRRSATDAGDFLGRQGVRRWLCTLPAWALAMALASVAHLGLLAWAYRTRAALYPDSGYRFLGLGADLAAAPLRYAAQFVAPPPWTEPLTTGAAGLALGVLALLGAAAWAWRSSPMTRLGLAWAMVAAAPFVLFGVYGVVDRYYYLPSVGLALGLAVGLARARRARGPAVASYAAAALVLLVQVGGEWQQAGAMVRDTMDYLEAWSRGSQSTPPEAAAFVGVPFKRGERWPDNQVYIFSTGLVGAAHLATGWPELRVSYVFADEQPALTGWLESRPLTPGPPGLNLFALNAEPPVDLTPVLGGALADLARLRWRGASRTPIDWARYTNESSATSAR